MLSGIIKRIRPYEMTEQLKTQTSFKTRSVVI